MQLLKALSFLLTLFLFTNQVQAKTNYDFFTDTTVIINQTAFADEKEAITNAILITDGKATKAFILNREKRNVLQYNPVR